VLILPEASQNEVVQKAELLRHNVNTIELDDFASELKNLSISLGVATFPSHGSTRTSQIREADAALLQAKTGGRNRVVSVLYKKISVQT
jgi:diguanylate cyclase (GGDEF)-like protein